MSSIIEKVETFVQRLHDLDYIISPEAGRIIYSNPLSTGLTPKERTTLTDHLANAITDYQQHKDDNKEDRLLVAQLCLIWINRTFACGVVKEGQGLARQLKECQEKNAQLEKDIEKISVDYLNLKETQERLAFTRYVKLPDQGDSEDKDDLLT